MMVMIESQYCHNCCYLTSPMAALRIAKIIIVSYYCIGC